MHPFLQEAQAMAAETIAHRRYLHENAELGFELPKTIDFVKTQLRAVGYDPIMVGGGVTCTVGQGAPCLMLRADMDALPQEEQSGLPFACKSGACHSCGHDAHTAILLSVAKMLKVHESALQGTVKFMFQPGEETLKGSQQMIDAGILTNPKVDAAMAIHMNFGDCGTYDLHAGTLVYSAHQTMPSADEFRITVHGRAAHGATAYQGVSAVSVAAYIILALQQLIALEVPSDAGAILSIGKMMSGIASNVIPEEAVIMGNCRTYTREEREHLKKRITELSQSMAATWRAEAQVDFIAGVSPNINDPDMAKEMGAYSQEIMERVEVIPPVKGSEDFANIGAHVPTFFANLCAGSPEDGYQFAMHNPKSRLDEKALPYGVALLSHCAVRWLQNHSA